MKPGDAQSKNICGPFVRHFREEKGWSQARLAAECQLAGWDISRETIAWIEGRRRWVGDAELLKLAHVLEVKAAQLLNE